MFCRTKRVGTADASTGNLSEWTVIDELEGRGHERSPSYSSVAAAFSFPPRSSVLLFPLTPILLEPTPSLHLDNLREMRRRVSQAGGAQACEWFHKRSTLGHKNRVMLLSLRTKAKS